MRKLWNRPALPVWSLITADSQGVANANICTYVTSISLSPKLIVVAVYKKTQTLTNLESGSPALLCLLAEDQANLVRICGRMSGKVVTKFDRLSKKHRLRRLNHLPYFTDSCGVLSLKLLSLTDTPGDHYLATMRVTASKNLNDKTILTTEYLRAKRLIR